MGGARPARSARSAAAAADLDARAHGLRQDAGGESAGVELRAVARSRARRSAGRWRSRRVFGHARAIASVLVLDECERLVVAESGRAALLQQLDEGVGRSLLVATTSKLDALDAAVLARFDEVVELPLPAVAEVERLLRMSLSAMRCEAGMPWAELARACVGRSAAAVVRVAREAGKAAVLQGGAVVTSGLLREAVAAFGEVRES